MKKTFRCRGVALAYTAIAMSAVAIVGVPASQAEPASDDDLIRPLPVITPTSTNWVPKFPFSLRSNEESRHGCGYHRGA